MKLPLIGTLGALVFLACAAPPPAAATEQIAPETLRSIEDGLEEMREAHGVTALLVGIGTGETIDLLAAAGNSMTDVPATTDMHFRAGAMAIASMTTILLQLVDEGVVALDDTIDRWLPDYPAADKVTLRMLADSSSGYADYMNVPEFLDTFENNVFYPFSTEELLDYAFAQDMRFEPGTDFFYAHTNFVVLGEALAAATGEPYETLLQRRIIDRLGLAGTEIWTTAALPDPPLHAFTSERGVFEDSTYWSPSWTSHTGPLNGNLVDVVRLMRALAVGVTLTPESLEEMSATTNVGRNINTEDGYFSLGMEMVRPWVRKTFMFGGYGGHAAYHPGADLTLVVVTTLGPDINPGVNPSSAIFAEIAEMLGH